MKRFLPFALLTALSVVLISWGGVGHKTVATIAYNHLTPKAKVAVKVLLGDTTMADVASWADEVVRQPEYRHTAPWHYVNAPLGLNYQAFSEEVTSQTVENVYGALFNNEEILNSLSSTIEQKAVALRFIIHFVGDLHQPMHVSRKEDKGGNTIQIQYDGKGTNLHSLWDSKLIGTEGKDFSQMAIDYDNATAIQIKQWQADEPLKWLWESYQISTKLYGEIEQSNKLDEVYYKSHIGIVHQRIEMAGIRLAGLLNSIFKNYRINHGIFSENNSVKETEDLAVDHVTLDQLKSFVGEGVIGTEGKVYGYKKFSNFTLVNVGAAYPNQKLTLLLKGASQDLANSIDGKTIVIIGKVTLYKVKPQIVVDDAINIILK